MLVEFASPSLGRKGDETLNPNLYVLNPKLHSTDLGDAEAAALQHFLGVAHEVQEGAVGGLADDLGAQDALPFGGGGHPPPLVEDHEGVELGVALHGDGLLEPLRQAIHQVLQQYDVQGCDTTLT